MGAATQRRIRQLLDELIAEYEKRTYRTGYEAEQEEKLVEVRRLVRKEWGV